MDAGLNPWLYLLYPRVRSDYAIDQPNDNDPRWPEIMRLEKLLERTVPEQEVRDAKKMLCSDSANPLEEQEVVGMIRWFAAHVFQGEPIEPWVLQELATRLYDATTYQCSLSETMPLPWAKRSRAPKAERDNSIYEKTTSFIADGIPVAQAIEKAGAMHGLSYDTARPIYYKIKNNWESLKNGAEKK